MYRIGQIVQHRDTGSEYVVVSRDAKRNFSGNIYLSPTDFDGRHIRSMSVGYYLGRNLITESLGILFHEEVELAPQQPTNE